MTAAPITITMKYGAHHWVNVPFDTAAEVLESHVDAEQKACNWHVDKLNQDHWIVSFWSEVLGGAKPPDHADWIRPKATLDSARSAYRAHQAQAAAAKFKQAVDEFNAVHKKWMTYRNKVEAGAASAITVMEVTIATMSAAAGGALGGTLVQGAGAAGAFKAVEESAKGLGLFFYGVEDKVDIARLFANVGEEMVKSLVLGKLAEKFVGVLAPRLSATWRLDPELAKALAQPGAGSRAQKLVTDFFSNMGYNILRGGVARAIERARGRQMSLREFMPLVADEVVKQMTLSNASSQAWLDFAKNHASLYLRAR